jgi:hypothetical protein
MLGLVLSQLQQKVGTWMALCRAKVFQLILLCNNIIVDGITRLILIAQYIKSQLVALKLNIKALVAQLTNQVPLMKLGLMNVLHKVGQVGQQVLIIARQIRRRVLNLLKQGH